MPQSARAWHKIRLLPFPCTFSSKTANNQGFQMRYCVILYHKRFWSFKLSNLKRLDFFHFCQRRSFNFDKLLKHPLYVLEKCSISQLKVLIDGCLEPDVQGKGIVVLFHVPWAFRMENQVCAFCFFTHKHCEFWKCDIFGKN